MLISFKNTRIIPLAFVVSLALTACGDKQTQTQPQSLPVDVYNVKSMEVPVVSRLTGRASAIRWAEVRPQVSGIIQERLFTEGSTVNKGDQLYQIDPSLYEAEVENAKANLSSAKASCHTAQLKAERYRKLLESKSVSKQDYDDAQALYLQAKATVEASEAQLKTAEINLAYTKVYAPISGRIDRSTVTEGALVSAQQATALTTIQQLDTMYIDLGQSVEDHLKLRKEIADGNFKNVDGKAAVDIYFSNGQKYNYQGQLEFSEVSVDKTTGMVNLRAIVPNPDGIILPGMFLRADLQEGSIPNAVVVEQGAIIREAAGTSYVFLIDENNKAKRQDVTVDGEYGSYYIVTNGLKVGDKVITSNTQKIRTGTPVVDVTSLPQKEEQK